MSIETSIIYTTSDDKQFNSRQEAETHPTFDLAEANQ